MSRKVLGTTSSNRDRDGRTLPPWGDICFPERSALRAVDATCGQRQAVSFVAVRGRRSDSGVTAGSPRPARGHSCGVAVSANVLFSSLVARRRPIYRKRAAAPHESVRRSDWFIRRNASGNAAARPENAHCDRSMTTGFSPAEVALFSATAAAGSRTLSASTIGARDR
jgi:hypothetical protein